MTTQGSATVTWNLATSELIAASTASVATKAAAESILSNSFGNVLGQTITAVGIKYYFNPADLQATDIVLAWDMSGAATTKPTIVLRPVGNGYVVLTGDEGIFRGNFAGTIDTNNEIFGANLMSWAATATSSDSPPIGKPITDLVSGSSIIVSDTDSGSSVLGFAVTSAASFGGDQWEYSIDSGITWVAFPAVSTVDALLISGSTLVRWTGAQSTRTQFSLVAVDDTEAALPGNTINVTTRGGETPYSADEATLSASAPPVVLDLNGDGEISYSKITADINQDGLDDISNWVGPVDGILYWDKNGDGTLTGIDQWAFVQYGGKTDLEGLAAGFDSNRDGILDAQDNRFEEFSVWQDHDQDGAPDIGELISLMDVGITSINLTSDGVERTPIDGITEHGNTTAVLTSGETIIVVDVSLGYLHGVDIYAVV